MTLEDLKKLFGEAIDKAHFVVSTFTKNEKVDGVSLCLDSDGVMSMVFHTGHLQGRTETTESQRLKNALEVYEYFGGLNVKELDGAFIDWGTLADALGDYKYWKDEKEEEANEIPDRIEALLKDRNALAKEIEALKKNLQIPKKKEEPREKSKAKKGDANEFRQDSDKTKTAPAALKSAETHTTRSKVFDYVNREQPVSVVKITEHLRADKSFLVAISYDDIEQILNHEWFEKRKAGWRIAIKEKTR